MWSHLKHSAGIYFITREKSNSAATISSANLIDPTDPRNEGIESEHFVSPSYGEALRRITYTDPADGTTYVYLTNEMKIPAYQLVVIYKQRWDIEKSSTSSRARWRRGNPGRVRRAQSATTRSSSASRTTSACSWNLK